VNPVRVLTQQGSSPRQSVVLEHSQVFKSVGEEIYKQETPLHFRAWWLVGNCAIQLGLYLLCFFMPLGMSNCAWFLLPMGVLIVQTAVYYAFGGKCVLLRRH
jgi:hypothetical protein